MGPVQRTAAELQKLRLERDRLIASPKFDPRDARDADVARQLNAAIHETEARHEAAKKAPKTAQAPQRSRPVPQAARPPQVDPRIATLAEEAEVIFEKLHALGVKMVVIEDGCAEALLVRGDAREAQRLLATAKNRLAAEQRRPAKRIEYFRKPEPKALALPDDARVERFVASHRRVREAAAHLASAQLPISVLKSRVHSAAASLRHIAGLLEQLTTKRKAAETKVINLRASIPERQADVELAAGAGTDEEVLVAEAELAATWAAIDTEEANLVELRLECERGEKAVNVAKLNLGMAEEKLKAFTPPSPQTLKRLAHEKEKAEQDARAQVRAMVWWQAGFPSWAAWRHAQNNPTGNPPTQEV